MNDSRSTNSANSLMLPVLPDLDEAFCIARAEWPIALISMPFVSCLRPSIQLGLLKSIANAHAFPATTLHLNQDFAKQIGHVLYEGLCDHRGRLFGDWLFSAAAFGSDAPDPDDRLLSVFSTDVERLVMDLGETKERLCEIRHVEVPRYLDHLLETIPWDRYKVVGFSSTFQQNAASFALAKRIKQAFPQICLLFGGANFEGEMGLELVRTMDCIDFAILGEGDSAFPEFLVALQEGRSPLEVAGVVARKDGKVSERKTRPSFKLLDNLPVPDYSEFFTRAVSLGLLPPNGRRTIGIPFESSRGCWWGEKSHCTFCGLNASNMVYRSKSSDRVLTELDTLAQQYGSFSFEAVDNILDMAYLEKIFTRLAMTGKDYEFFYEVKSNLTRDRIRSLYQGGVRTIQPGIESLSSHVLKLMCKGVTAIQNVNTLRWAQYYGLSVGWNLLWGFPGETQDDYHQQATLLKHLHHLQPPVSGGRIWMERFSPVFMDRERFPTHFIRPEASYDYVYPSYMDKERIAYFFDYEFCDHLPDSVYEETREQIRTWQSVWKEDKHPSLTFWASPGLVCIEDRRDPNRCHSYSLTETLASLYAHCSESPQKAESLRVKANTTWDLIEIEMALNELCARGLMLSEGELFLSLALPAIRGR